MKKSIAENIQRLTDFANGILGRLLVISERVTRVPGSLDRHVSTHSQFQIHLRYFGVAFSGAAITFDGGKDGLYQISCDALISAEFGDGTATLIESFGDSAERHTVLRVQSESESVASTQLDT